MAEAHSNDPGPKADKNYLYAGYAVSGVGLLLFLSNFCIGAMAMDEGLHNQPSMVGFAGRGIGGMFLMVVGGVLTGRGAGKLLGGSSNLGTSRPMQPRPPVVKVRCPGCQSLQDEDAKFCDQCGKALIG